MKTFITSIILTLSLAANPLSGYGGESNTKTGVVGRRSTRTTNRPTAPSHAYIHFTYTSGYIDFILNPTMEYLDVTISKDDIPVWSGTVTQDEPSAEIPVLYGEYTIACITDNGQVYLGVLYF